MRRLAPLSLLALLAACGPAVYSPGAGPAEPNPRIVETSTGLEVHVRNDEAAVTGTVDAPLERVWAVLPEVYRDLGIPAGVLDADSHAFGNQRVSVTRVGGERVGAFVRCGNEGAGPSAANGYRTRLSVVTALQRDGGKTTVATRVGGTGSPVEGTSTEAVACVSNGRLEERIARMIADHFRVRA